ncbi:hypothetical protein TH53_24470 [Pedobacter lusitanus]|uniref:DUF4397 domain-containing protein n=1 Tax=Pedobacter lusitanus TaxID=1503925 RepID=A0A0D0GF05_9SPHI|nr:DUF4397 domain-containing protein [Pedobacter lusitanus]KIO74775.1 hypothetical protein TH53_24470 [Pedobacter lusitanus]
MKFNPTLFSKNIKRSTVFIALLGTALSFASCKKDSTPVQQDASAFAITNASPLRDSVDFILNGSRLNGSTPLLFGKTYNYLIVRPGTHQGGLARPGAPKTFYDKNFTLTNGQYQSLYLISQNDTSSFLLLKDDFTAPAVGQSKIRFVNLSSDSPAYDLVLEGDTTTFKNRAFKDFTQFKNIKPAKYKVSLVNTTTKAVAATLSDVDITAGNFYTIYAKGLLGSTVDAKKLSITSSIHKVQQN